MSIFDEAQQVEHLAVIAKSLIKYSMSLEPGLAFERHSNWWLAGSDKNFVGFQFHWTNVVSITLSLYGPPDEQFKQDDLGIKQARFDYSICRITEEYQLMAATVCIWRAHQLFHAPREKVAGTLELVDAADANRDNWLRPRPGLPNYDDNSEITVSETTEWYDEVKAFMRRNKIIDSSIFH